MRPGRFARLGRGRRANVGGFRLRSGATSKNRNVAPAGPSGGCGSPPRRVAPAARAAGFPRQSNAQAAQSTGGIALKPRSARSTGGRLASLRGRRCRCGCWFCYWSAHPWLGAARLGCRSGRQRMSRGSCPWQAMLSRYLWTLLVTPSIHRDTRHVAAASSPLSARPHKGATMHFRPPRPQQAHRDPHDQRATVRLGSGSANRAKPTARQIRGPNR